MASETFIRCRAGIDVGAGEGEYALFFLTKTDARRVWVFEPLNECRDVLVKNLGSSGLDADQRLTLSAEFVGHGGSGQTTLDALLREVWFPALIKVDMDGAEVDVLRGATGLLRKQELCVAFGGAIGHRFS